MSVYIVICIIGLSNRLFNRSENKDASPAGSILLVGFVYARACAHSTDLQHTPAISAVRTERVLVMYGGLYVWE